MSIQNPLGHLINGESLWILAVGPFFAALTGVGFKEFFCFRRPEAIGVTLLLPLALLGRLSGLLPLATAVAGFVLNHERPSSHFWLAAVPGSAAVVLYALDLATDVLQIAV